MSKKSKPNVSISIDKAIVCFNGDKLATDASGNNAAFECPCPNCKHPVLLVIGCVNDKGLFPKRPAECPRCHQKYVVDRMVVNKVHIEIATAE